MSRVDLLEREAPCEGSPPHEAAQTFMPHGPMSQLNQGVHTPYASSPRLRILAELA
jgi:hypothetical protein